MQLWTSLIEKIINSCSPTCSNQCSGFVYFFCHLENIKSKQENQRCSSCSSGSEGTCQLKCNRPVKVEQISVQFFSSEVKGRLMLTSESYWNVFVGLPLVVSAPESICCWCSAVNTCVFVPSFYGQSGSLVTCFCLFTLNNNLRIKDNRSNVWIKMFVTFTNFVLCLNPFIKYVSDTESRINSAQVWALLCHVSIKQCRNTLLQVKLIHSKH